MNVNSETHAGSFHGFFLFAFLSLYHARPTQVKWGAAAKATRPTPWVRSSLATDAGSVLGDVLHGLGGLLVEGGLGLGGLTLLLLGSAHLMLALSLAHLWVRGWACDKGMHAFLCAHECTKLGV